MRVVEVLIAFPFYVLVIGLIFVVGTGTTGSVSRLRWSIGSFTPGPCPPPRSWCVSPITWPRPGPAACPRRRILWRHVLPNTVTQSVVYLTSDIILVIVAVVTLGYLGLGCQPPTPGTGRHDQRRPGVPYHFLGAGDHPGCGRGHYGPGPFPARRRPGGCSPAPVTCAPRMNCTDVQPAGLAQTDHP